MNTKNRWYDVMESMKVDSLRKIVDDLYRIPRDDLEDIRTNVVLLQQKFQNDNSRVKELKNLHALIKKEIKQIQNK